MEKDSKSDGENSEGGTTMSSPEGTANPQKANTGHLYNVLEVFTPIAIFPRVMA